ncbi:hypothetical protein RBE51_10965 [Pseudomonas taiwanensis]|uniref:hypothetical protein n=1 Tax=Pseudomonas taiwanensis TaxID=470150 RepID=UPI0028E042BC|nr:hypothetical protein [Pseudomonas taiwanensis]MDT8923341.1 hypothetical protein [Pseudomonas taiwanensis]
MNKHIFSILEPGNPLMTQALDAMKRYYEAQAAKASEVELERLRLEAESLFQAVSEFQQRVMGRRDDTLH